MTHETGTRTAAANDLALAVMTDGDAHDARIDAGFAMLAGHAPAVTFRDLCNAQAKRSRAAFGSTFRPSDVTEAASIVQAQTIAICVELIRDAWDGTTIDCNVRRWFDAVDGNSYFSAAISVPTGSGRRLIVVPYQYGYESLPDQAIAATLKAAGFPGDAPTLAHDYGYGLKRDTHRGGVYLAYV